MRIVQIISASQLRGAEVAAAQLSNELAARGHDVSLVALSRPAAGLAELEANDAVRRVQLRARPGCRLEPSALWRLRRVFQRLRPDVVQANGFPSLKYASLLKRFTGAHWPLVYRNISMAGQWIRNGWQRPWGCWLLEMAEQVLSVSDASAADFRQTYLLPESRVATIRQGIVVPSEPRREDVRRTICERIGCEWETPLLFHVGSLTPEKNHAGLLEALRLVRERFPSAQLVLCGDGPLRPEIERQIADCGLSDGVHLLGNRPDAAELLAAADLLLLPSHVEGIPGVVLEAAARRVPAVCTNVGGIAEAVVDGETGRLVPARDMPALADATCTLLSRPDERERMARAAYRLVLARHEFQQSVDRFEEVYRRLVIPAGAQKELAPASC